MNKQSAPSTSAARIQASTRDLPERERLAIWREGYVQRLFNIGVEPDTETSYHANMDIRPIRAGAIGSMSSSRAHYYVGKEHLSNAQDTLTLTVMRSGRVCGRQRGKEVVVGPGQAFLVLNNETVTMDLLEESQALNLYLSIPAVASLVPDLGRALVERVANDSVALELLTNYATVLHRTTAMLTPDQENMMSSHILDLVANALGTFDRCAEKTQGGIGAARRQAIKADIAAHLSQGDLSPEMTAQRLGISPRYLSRLLHDDGTSYTSLLRYMRLRKAHRLLTDPRQMHCSISAIAYDVGFNDLSYFNRCFRSHFGMTPGEARNEARRAG